MDSCSTFIISYDSQLCCRSPPRRYKKASSPMFTSLSTFAGSASPNWLKLATWPPRYLEMACRVSLLASSSLLSRAKLAESASRKVSRRVVAGVGRLRIKWQNEIAVDRNGCERPQLLSCHARLRFILKETQCSCGFLIGGVDSAMNGSEVLKDESWSMLKKNLYIKKLAHPRRN